MHYTDTHTHTYRYNNTLHTTYITHYTHTHEGHTPVDEDCRQWTDVVTNTAS